MVRPSFLFGKRTKAYRFTCEQTGGNLRERSNDVVTSYEKNRENPSEVSLNIN